MMAVSNSNNIIRNCMKLNCISFLIVLTPLLLSGQSFTGTIKYAIHKNKGDNTFSNPSSSGIDTLVYYFTDSVVVMETRVAKDLAIIGPLNYELIHLPTSTAYTYNQTSKEWKIREYRDSSVRTTLRSSTYNSKTILGYNCVPFTRKIDDKHISDREVNVTAIESSGKAILWAAPHLRISADHPALDFMSVSADGVRYLALSKEIDILSSFNSSVFGAIGRAYNFEHKAISITPQVEGKFQDILQLWHSKSKKP